MAEMDALLALAIKHVSQGKARVEQQEKIVKRLASYGPQALPTQLLAHELLKTMRVSLSHMMDDKLQIERLHTIRARLSEAGALPRKGLLFPQEQLRGSLAPVQLANLPPASGHWVGPELPYKAASGARPSWG